MKRSPGFFLGLLLSILLASACSGAAAGEPLRIVSGSENATLEPLLQEFSRKQNVPIAVTYKGSVDIMLELEHGTAIPYDAVWPASNLWVAPGDQNAVVKHQASIMRSPVVLGVKCSVAERLGWTSREVRVADILAAAESGRLRFLMTSASQSNSGAAAYFSYLYAFAGQPEVLTTDHLRVPAVRDQTKRILGAVNRSAGSSGWLKELFLERYESFDAMVNYEALVIEMNQELATRGREPLYAIYPVDGLAIADSPLGYVNKGSARKEEQFLKLQEYLLSPDVQNRILAQGRRTGPLGLQPGSANQAVFNPAWGIELGRVINPIRLPPPDVIREALGLYQTAFRKPSFTVFALDFSGSMEGQGDRDMKAAMRLLLYQPEARRYLLQATPGDVVAVLAFSDRILKEWSVSGNDDGQLERLYEEIYREQPRGGTDIYTPVMRGLDLLRAGSYEDYAAAIILMTDGESNTGGNLGQLRQHLQRQGMSSVPVHSIMFGKASDAQLKEIASLTAGKVFDGRKSLVDAFREAKGYNN